MATGASRPSPATAPGRDSRRLGAVVGRVGSSTSLMLGGTLTAYASFRCHGVGHSTRLRVAETWLWSSCPTAAMSMTHSRLDSTRPYMRVAALYSLAPGARRTPSVLSWILAGSILQY